MNAKKEFIEFTKGREVKCAIVSRRDFSDEIETACLKRGYSPEDYESFLSALNFEYDEGYGSQELCGTIWFADGAWADRDEYDGSEWWELHERPAIPKELKQNGGTKLYEKNRD